jgi:DNA-directed RNA polymerase specialized sigma24 family protein
MDAAARRQLSLDLGRLASGDRSALDPAFEVLRPFVVDYCRRVLAGRGDPEDAAHEALLTLFANVHRYDAERDPVPWVLAFAVNACRTALRRIARRREVPAADDPRHDASAIELELRDAVMSTIGSLSTLDADTLRLAMGERPADATFRKRLSRAMARFRIAWRQDD